MNSSGPFQSHREYIAGVPCDFLSQEEYIRAITASLVSHTLTHIVTLNAEMVVLAHHDEKFNKAIHRAELIIPDSSGILWARDYINKKTTLLSFFFSRTMPLTGVESVDSICKEVELLHGSVYLIGGEEYDRKKTAQILQIKYKKLKITILSDLTFFNSPLKRGGDQKPSAIFVALGAPKQTMWIEQHRTQLEQAGIRIAIGIGGAFAMISGRLPRAPYWMRKVHLEWLWRLLLEPKRIHRIWNAIIVFPRLII
ncbi:MAG TPA: WecB/TagA/CpsF family glycosyltransferase, partial [Candidatus Andersenbacteria bacterium]|nr:WecB/TagA/CpsF family glycosyltransferase [Candidatus Andersenbacteria bacterium]